MMSESFFSLKRDVRGLKNTQTANHMDPRKKGKIEKIENFSKFLKIQFFKKFRDDSPSSDSSTSIAA